MPSIAGISPFSIEECMFEYRYDARPCRRSGYQADCSEWPPADVHLVAKYLSNEEISEVIEFCRSKEFKPEKAQANLAASQQKIWHTKQ